ncbi:MAG: bifunctional phosphopantothenoylcysteine decarboxylase/phosphopantothenate--cysteine ligase CoaBC [Firmicutes bacterium]|nr:bifunctional phosphopantothenoylcysteine decarboxylase/phosphopantothenate--cysteine ligase CoaBC [Bacillota bacterium]
MYLVGVTGGIAAYKTAELVRLFMREGNEVQVVMTPGAAQFVTPLTFQTLTGRPALVDQFWVSDGEKVRHIDLASAARVFVIAPATANTIGKLARGIADNLLTTIYLAARCPVVVVPSMNEQMYLHPAVQENLSRLREHGCLVMEPDTGDLACGICGKGRLPELSQIAAFVSSSLREKDFRGLRALVTAGPTREPLDPVRFISNRSTGRMGYAIAAALAERGAKVILVSGPTALPRPAGVEFVPVETARQMHGAVLERFGATDLVIKAAAVSDYCPAETAEQKIKKGDGRALTLQQNPDILEELGRCKEKQILVGFAMETEKAAEYAREKLRRKNLDLIVLNDLTVPGAGFGSLTNQVCIFNRAGGAEELPLMSKELLAHRILDRVRPLVPARP